MHLKEGLSLSNKLKKLNQEKLYTLLSIDKERFENLFTPSERILNTGLKMKNLFENLSKSAAKDGLTSVSGI